VVGIMTDAFPQELPDALVTPIAIEYGTYAGARGAERRARRQLAASARRLSPRRKGPR
jgi:hypothetical protein